MTVLDSFLAFTRSLSAEQRETVEEALAALMDSLSSKFDFTPAERDEIERRMAEIEPEFAESADIAKLFGKPFRA
jgi:hypothetical protein